MLNPTNKGYNRDYDTGNKHIHEEGYTNTQLNNNGGKTTTTYEEKVITSNNGGHQTNQHSSTTRHQTQNSQRITSTQNGDQTTYLDGGIRGSSNYG